MYSVLRLNMYTGDTERILTTDTRIRSMAYYSEEDTIVIRKSRRLEFYNNKTLELERGLDFEKLDYWWSDMCFADDRILVIDRDTGFLKVFYRYISCNHNCLVREGL